MRRKLIACLVGILFFAVVFIPYISGHVVESNKTIIVPDDYPTIQEAINHASSGDTIFVRSGVYNENLVISKSLDITGENRETTIIDGSYKVNQSVVTIYYKSVYISGFTIRSNNKNIGISCNRPGLDGIFGHTITNNIITNNVAGIVVSALYAEKSLISNNIITNNSMLGINILHVCDNIVSNNIVKNNGEGIICVSSVSNKISGNEISSNEMTGIGLAGSFNNAVFDNTIMNNGMDGIRLKVNSCSNTLSNNTIMNNKNTGISLLGGIRMQYQPIL